ELYSDNNKAIREMTRATAMGYRSPRLYLDLATAHQIQRNTDKARQTYQEFLRRYPSHKSAAEVRSIINNTL
ncbi:MAG: tetratricopeptide repeat protein, partial [Myxococcota bacterium]